MSLISIVHHIETGVGGDAGNADGEVKIEIIVKLKDPEDESVEEREEHHDRSCRK